MRRTPLTILVVGILLGVVILMSGCDLTGETPSADRQQSAQTQELQALSNQTVGMPGITSFTEKQLVADLYTMRDQQDLNTYSYTIDFQGRLWHICDSTGYGIPFSAQFTNPAREVYRTYDGGHGTLPQPEPNGLWVPESSSATWVICSSAEGSFEPMYVESPILVSQVELNSVGSYQIGR